MAQDMFKFVLVESGKQTYDNLAVKDSNTLYAITETSELYFDGNLIADKNVIITETKPVEAGQADKIYVVTTGDDKGIYHYDTVEGAYLPVVSYSDFVTADAEQTLTNKTIDADSNTISNLEVDNFKAEAVAKTISTSAVDTKLVTEKAVRTQLDAKANKNGSNATGTWGIDITGKAQKDGNGNVITDTYQEKVLKIENPDVIKGWTFKNIIKGDPDDPDYVDLAAICYGKGKYIVASYSDGLYYSTDGIEWQKGSTTYNFKNITFCNNIFVGTTRDTKKVYYSSDGITWSQASVTGLSSSSYLDLYSAKDTFYVYDSTSKVTYLSKNGYSWSTSSVAVMNVIYNDVDNIYLATVDASSTTTIPVYKSTNGTTWGKLSDIPAANRLAMSFAYGNGNYFITTSEEHIHSTDGINWTVASDIFPMEKIGEVYFHNGTFYGFIDDMDDVDDYVLFTSTDGVTWEGIRDREFEEHGSIENAAFGNRIVFQTEGGLFYSEFDVTTIELQSTILNLMDSVDTLEDTKVDKVEGYSLVSDEEIARLAELDTYTHPNIAEAVSTGVAYNKVTFDENGHVATATAETTLAGLGINDAYTKEEVNAKLSDLIQGLDWKEAVDTYEDIATTYDTPEEGWTVSVKDTNDVYRYDAETSAWINVFSADTNIVEASVDGVGGHAGLMTAAMAEKLASIEAGGQVNQNAFSTIVAGEDTLASDAESDTVKLVGGENITISGETVDGVKTITIAGPETYIHPELAEGVETEKAYNKVTFDENGHVATATAETTLKGLGVAGESDDITAMTGYEVATEKAAISAADSLNVAIGKLEYRINNQADELEGVLNGKVGKDQMATTISSESTDDEVVTAKAVYEVTKVVRI